MRIRLTLNGRETHVECRPEDRLGVILRDQCDVRSARIDCATGRCGSCVVLFEGRIVSSCLIPMFRAVGAEIMTVEGLYGTQDLVDIERGFERASYEPCQYCAPVKALLAHAIISETTKPRQEELFIQAQTIRCRCTGYRQFVEAIQYAAEHRRTHARE